MFKYAWDPNFLEFNTSSPSQTFSGAKVLYAICNEGTLVVEVVEMLQLISIICQDGGLFMIKVDNNEYSFWGVHEKSNLFSCDFKIMEQALCIVDGVG